jgi:hypothetical protein
MTNLSRIQIGTSNTDCTQLILKSKYKVKSIIMDPFGSTKLRFQYPSAYNFAINDENYSNQNFIYNININKKPGIVLGNLNGWTNNLTITCLPDNFLLDLQCLINFIPENYGDIEINNIINSEKKYKFGIVIPTFGRYSYLKTCFESLSNCVLEDCIIVIVDESMTKEVNQDKIDTTQFIKSYNFLIPTIKIYKKNHKNMFDSINVGLDILGQVCDYLMTLDSDTIHNKNFIPKLCDTYFNVKNDYPDKSNNLLVLSGFNTKKHTYIDNDEHNYYIKNTVGGCHLFFNALDYWKHIRYTLISYKWDTNIYNLVNRLNGIIAVTKPSVIEHIGKISSVRVDNIPYDSSIDFNLDNTEIINKKLYLICEDLELENKQTWIIDVFKNEFVKYSGLNFVSDPAIADIIWIIGMGIEKIKHLKTIDLTKKKIITTIHHIDWDKIDLFNENFNLIKDITTNFHVICNKVYGDLIKLTQKPIVIANFWINENLFYPITNKNQLRNKYLIPEESYCVGSFQRDTEGKKLCLKPKLSKGPDIFIKIVSDMHVKNNNLLIILTGRRRNYIIGELEKKSIKYLYFPMINSLELNELYNCLDLYIVSSRVEGGPRAIIECGIAKVPLISTDVGISELILNNESIYDKNNPLTYSNAKPNVIYAYEKSNNYTIENYLQKFITKLFVE